MRPDPSIPHETTPHEMTPHEMTPVEDLVVFRLGRRALRRDVGLHTAFADGLLAGTEYLDARRLEVFSEVADELCADIVREQQFEDTLLWPVLERRAAEALPFASLRADREGLRRLVDDARRATRAVVADLAQRPAALATREDHQRVQALADAWRSLRERLEAFFDATEDGVAEIVTTAVPRAEWAEILEAVRRGLPDRRTAGARVMDVASAEELAALRGQLGSRPVAGWRNQGRRHRSEEALLFGTDPAAARPAEGDAQVGKTKE